MAPTNREANIVFKIDGANQSRQEVDKVRKAFEDFGNAGKTAAQPAVDGLEAIQRGVDKVEKKIAQGRTVTVRDISEMAVNFKRLEDTIVHTFGAIENAPKDIQASWQLASDQLKRVEVEVVKSNKAIEDQKNVTNQAGASWSGWGNAIDNVNPKLGKLTAQLGTVAAAFTAGWTAGQKLNSFFQTDMSEWSEVSSNLGRRIGVILAALSDQIVAIFNLVKSTSSGSFSEMKRAASELGESVKKSQQTIADAFTTSGAEFDKLHPKMGATAAAAKELAEAEAKAAEETAKLAAENDKLAAANEKSADAAKKGSDAQKAAGEETKLTAAQIRAQTEAAKEQAAAMEAAGRKVISYRDDQGKLHIETVNVAAKTPQAAAAIEALGAATGAASPQAALLKATFEGLVDALPTAPLFGIRDALVDIGRELDNLIEKAPQAAEALKELGTSASQAAGEGDADFIGPVQPK
jgi:hypothetical protein